MIIFRCKNTKFLKKTTIFHLFFLILPERPTGVTLIRPPPPECKILNKPLRGTQIYAEEADFTDFFRKIAAALSQLFMPDRADGATTGKLLA